MCIRLLCSLRKKAIGDCVNFETAIYEILLPKLATLGFILEGITKGEMALAIFSNKNIQLRYQDIGRLDDGKVEISIGDKTYEYSELLQKIIPKISIDDYKNILGGWQAKGLKCPDYGATCQLIVQTIDTILNNLDRNV
jgi:hypothetical protein